MSEYRIQLGFSHNPDDIVGRIRLNGKAKRLYNLHEYAITPEYIWNKDTKRYEVSGYGLIHRSKLSPEFHRAMTDREERANDQA